MSVSSKTVSFASASSILNVRRSMICVAFAVATIAGGCANNGSGGLFSTGALGDQAATAEVAKPVTDPACVSMAQQIDTLRKEGSVERLEKAADGKTPAVSVQRAALAKQTQLNKLNADFIAKCGPSLPKSNVTASLATPVQPVAAKPVAAAAKPVTAAKAAAAAPAASTSGVTVAAPAAATVAPVVQQ